MRRWLPLLMLVGCGEDSPPGFELRDGDRLKLRNWMYDDGTRHVDPTGFFDAKINAACTALPWSDGHTYCTPDVLATVTYADAGCRQPVGRAPAGAEPPTIYRRDYTFESKTLTSRTYVPTDEREPLERMWIFDGKSCVGPFDDAGSRYFDVEELDMVRLYESAPIGDGRVRAAITTTDDGLQAPGLLRDTALDVDCEPQMGTDESVTCHPRDAVEAVFFREPTCTSERAISFFDSQPVPTVAKVTTEDSCVTYLRVVEEVVNFPLFLRQGDACVAVELTDHERVFTVGPLDLAPLATRTVDAGSRLQVIELVDGELHVPGPMLFDTLLGSECMRLEDGGFGRCVPRPTTVSPSPYYTDPDCTSYTPGIRTNRRSCDPAPRFAAAWPRGRLAVAELLPQIAGPLYQVVGGACVVSPVTDVRPQGQLIPLESFVTAVHE